MAPRGHVRKAGFGNIVARVGNRKAVQLVGRAPALHRLGGDALHAAVRVGEPGGTRNGCSGACRRGSVLVIEAVVAVVLIHVRNDGGRLVGFDGTCVIAVHHIARPERLHAGGHAVCIGCRHGARVEVVAERGVTTTHNAADVCLAGHIARIGAVHNVIVVATCDAADARCVGDSARVGAVRDVVACGACDATDVIVLAGDSARV